MKKLWLALSIFAGGMAHELRNPLTCQSNVPARLALVVNPRRGARRPRG